MPIDSFAKRMATGGLPFPLGVNVLPGTLATPLGRAAAAWSYLAAEPPPPTPGELGGIQIGIGQKKSFSSEPILGGGGSW